MLLVLIVANGWAVAAPPVADAFGARVRFRYEPPHSAFVRWLSWSPTVLDSLCGAPDLLSLNRSCIEDEVGVLSTLPPIARVGHSYTYTPRIARPVAHWSLEASAAGFRIDSLTGRISGTPTAPDTIPLAVSARFEGDSLAIQHVRLFIDDRYLPLGADGKGEDVLLQLVRASRFMLLPGLITVLSGVVSAVVAGALAGFYGGAARQWLSVATSTLQSIPGLLLVIVAVAASGFDRIVVMMVVGLILFPETALGILERVEHFRRRDFVEAARELGLRDRTILWNEIVWHNARDFVVNRVATGFSFAVLMDVTLGYVGLVDVPSGSLGVMANSGRIALQSKLSNSEAVAAMIGLLFVIATFTLLDRGVRVAWARSR